MPPFIQVADERAYAWLARSETPVLDATLPRLSRAANRSRLWMAIAAVLAMLGGRKGRSAAVRGLTAIGITSALVNGPLKLLSRRHRPESSTIPLIRQLSHLPLSSSFPSGHAASAVAFATAASLELPAAAVPLGVLATGVAVSRVYTGVHYPSDVVVGAAIGASVGVLTQRAADARRRQIPPATSLHEQGKLDVAGGRGLVIGVNTDAGSAHDSLADRLREAFPEATIVTGNGSLADELRARSGSDTAAIVCAGGDGTINLAAGIAMERGVPLGVIPSGTLNHLAHDLGLEDVDAGIEAIRQGHLAQIDVGMIAEHPVLNTASFGAYSEFVDKRESLEEKIGKWPAAMVALGHLIRHNSPLRVEIDGRPMSIWAIFIGNGPYAPSGFVPIRRKALDDGQLDIRVLRADRSYPRTRALIGQSFRRLERSGSLETWSADRVDVRSLEGPLRLAHDGETFDGPERFTIEKSPKQLQIFIPRAKD
jgi:undecaprenyl-diphosphatase